MDTDRGHPLDPDSLEMRVLKEGARAARIKDYQWAESTKKFVDIPANFQDATPMTKRERKDLLKGIPDFTRTFPCKGPRALSTEDRARVRWWNELWFLEKGAPRLHNQMVDQLRALTYLAQECGDAKERIGLSLDELRFLLRKIIILHVDTMKLLSQMQVRRALLATNRSTDPREMDPLQFIISDKRRETEVKRAESKLAVDINASRPLLKGYAKAKKSPPAPFGGLGTSTPTGRGFFKRGRGRGRGSYQAYQGGTGRGQSNQL
jgi:hypothetical protein